MSSPTIVLASGSARRAALLEAARIPFRVLVPRVSEDVDRELLRRGTAGIVAALAERKAAAALALDAGESPWVLGADTLVETDDGVLAKAGDAGEARDMIRRLSGRPHRVLTGLALIPGTGKVAEVATCTTVVVFRRLSEEEIDWYVGTGEWVGVAGAYRIQERAALLVEKISGSYSNVVGLPLETFYGMLVRHRYRFP